MASYSAPSLSTATDLNVKSLTLHGGAFNLRNFTDTSAVTTFRNTAQNEIVGQDPNVSQLLVKAFAGQAVPIFQVQSPSAVVYGGWNNSGNLFQNSGTVTAGSAGAGAVAGTILAQPASNTRGIVIKLAAGQSVPAFNVFSSADVSLSAILQDGSPRFGGATVAFFGAADATQRDVATADPGTSAVYTQAWGDAVRNRVSQIVIALQSYGLLA